MMNILKRGLSLVLVLVMMVGLMPVTAFAAVDSSGKPTDLNNTLVLSIYTPEGSFPGEPAMHGSEDYISFNSSFAKTSASGQFKANATTELNISVLDDLVQGASNGSNTVWGVFSADGLKEKYFKSDASIIQPANEAKIIRVIKGNAVKDMTDEEVLKKYEIIWYVIKLQHSPGNGWWSRATTEWHIDGLIREKSEEVKTITINYYGNGNTEGSAPDGITNHVAGENYTILAGNKMKKKINGVYVDFLGWSAKADGTGAEAGFYKPGDVIAPTESISLYAMWDTTTQYTATVNTYLDNVLTDEADIHGEDRELYLGTEGHYYQLTRSNEGVYTVKITGNGKFHLFKKNADDTYTQLGDHQLTIYNQNGSLDVHHYSVTYDANDGHFTADPGKQAYNYGSAVTAVADTPVMPGYRFLGWEDNNGNLIQPEEIVTSSITAPITLTAQWEKTVNVTVNVTINHGESGGGHDNVATRGDVRLDLVSRENSSSPYLEVLGKTLELTASSHAGCTFTETETQTKYEGYVFTDMPGGTVDYTVVTSKSDYDTKITATKDANGNWTIDVVMDYNPTNFDIAFTVHVDENLPEQYIPKAAIVKVTYWSKLESKWLIITQQDGGQPGVRVDIDPNTRQGSGTYPVWMYESDSTTPYGYRVVVTSFIYPDGTIVPASDVLANVEWSDNVYTATMDEVTGGQLYDTLNGAYYDDTSSSQKGTLNVEITMDLYNVTFDAQGGKVNGQDSQTVTQQYKIPGFKDYVPTREGGYTFAGWYEDEEYTIPATEGKDLTGNITLYAKWIEPLTISGTVNILGTYWLNGTKVSVNDIDKATEAVVVLQEIRDGKYYEVDSQKVTFAYAEDENGSASYSFSGIPNENKQYRIQLLLLNYTTKYDNESDVGTSYHESEYTAVFGGDNVADVDAELTFVPPSYEQKMEVDASAIANGYRPDSVLAQILYRDTGDNHPFNVISQHGEDSPAPHGVVITLDAEGKGAGSEWIWKWHTNGTLYDYQMDVSKVYGDVQGVFVKDGVAYNSDEAPFDITYTEPVYWDNDRDSYSGIMKATLIPKQYLITFDLNAGTDTVTGMDGFKLSYQDENGNTVVTDTYGVLHTWSYDTAINAVPQREGYIFKGWKADVESAYVDGKIPAAVHQEVTLTAQWEKITHTVTTTADPAEGGKVTGAGTYDYGTEVTITATANAGYNFLGWYENDTLVSNHLTYSFVVKSNRNFVAKFSLSQYTVTTEATPAEGGSTTGDGTYSYGTKVTLTATPKNGYAFAGWYNGSEKVSDDQNFTVTVTENLKYTAKFEKIVYQVTANAEQGGKAEGTANYHYGDSATVKATADANYTFAGWYEGGTKVSDAPEYTFTVTSNRTLTAKFVKNKYVVTTNHTGEGTTTGDGEYEAGATATVIATADTGNLFKGWYENGELVSTEASYSFTVTSNRTLTAQFEKIVYQVTANATTGGTATGTGTYEHGQTATVNATPEAGYAFRGWYEGTNLVSGDASYSFTVTSNRTLTAQFEKIVYQVTANATTGGTAEGSANYHYGDSATVKATADANYTFAGWYEGEAKVSDAPEYTFTVTSNRELTAKFVKTKYVVTTNHTGEGTTIGDGEYEAGATATVTATAAAGHLFKGWYEGETKVSDAPEYTFTVTSNRTLTAKFAIYYTITTIAQNGGSVSGGGQYEPNASATITAEADGNHYFVGWYDEADNLVSANAVYSLTVLKNRTFTAKFEEKKTYTCDYVYIFGYNDSEIGATGPLLRGELAQMIYRLVKQQDPNTQNGGNSFSDTAGEWFESGMSYMAEMGAIKRDQQRAHPYAQVTRGETYKMICLGLGFTTDTGLSFSEYATILRNSGYLQDDGRVTAMIQRWEFCKLFNAILGRSDYCTGNDGYIAVKGQYVTAETYGYTDLKPGDEYYRIMMIATSTFTDGKIDLEKRMERNTHDYNN